ncbi:NAD(P)-binding oxidoreductase [Spirillospora sp. CA-294931]|uniref:NAD(P)-binding oxidoreductase n=1 Tax=Spirillospora sp. CA-294931 TaxID=3240042 RepID=UPI003D8E47EE
MKPSFPPRSLVVAGSRFSGSTASLVGDIAAERGHDVRRLGDLGDGQRVRTVLADADAAVLVPKRGDARRHAHGAVSHLLAEAADVAPGLHLILVSSFAVGHGMAHPLNRVEGALLPARIAAEAELRSSGLPWTVVRPTWLTDDPPGSHAITLTQDPRTDGMVSRADLATVIVAAVEDPAARGTTFALFNEPGSPPADWSTAFGRLRQGEPVR